MWEIMILPIWKIPDDGRDGYRSGERTVLQMAVAANARIEPVLNGASNLSQEVGGRTGAALAIPWCKRRGRLGLNSMTNLPPGAEIRRASTTSSLGRTLIPAKLAS